MLERWVPSRLWVWCSYLGASAAALALDLAVFASLVVSAVNPAAAGAVGYLAGLALHWIVSSRFVFREATGAAGSSLRRQQALLFCATAGLGLVLTTGVIATLTVFAVPPWISKPIAVAVSFQSVWWVRRNVVFAPAR